MWHGNPPLAYASTFQPGYPPQLPFNTTLSLTGGYTDNTWQSANNGTTGTVNQRLVLDLGTIRAVRKVRVVNHHNVGLYEAARGVRAAKMYVMTTNPSTTYGANVSAATLVFDGEIQANDYTNGGATFQEFVLSKELNGQYFVCDFASNWGATDVMCVRRIQLGG